MPCCSSGSIVLTANGREDCSFGHGEAGYAVLPRDRWH